MPEPLSKLKLGSKVTFDLDVFQKYPALAAYPMQVISDWSSIDLHLGSELLASMLRTNVMTSVAMYTALRGEGPRETALRAAAEHSLDKDQLALFIGVLKLIDGSWKTRNKFAHHIWGYCDDLPDALCLTEPLLVAEYRRKLYEWNNANPRPTPAPPTIDHQYVYAYRKPDFGREIRDSRRAYQLVNLLASAVGNHFMSAGDKAKLMAMPDVAAAHAKALADLP